MYVEGVKRSSKYIQNMFLLITSLIFNGFSIRKKFWKAETWAFQPNSNQILCVKACQRYQRLF